jgi:hypothetical protein
MHQIDDAIVQGGQIVLSHLPFADGQRVRVIVSESGAPGYLSIEEVRRQLRGSVERFDDPTEPMIPQENWEMLK